MSQYLRSKLANVNRRIADLMAVRNNIEQQLARKYPVGDPTPVSITSYDFSKQQSFDQEFLDNSIERIPADVMIVKTSETVSQEQKEREIKWILEETEKKCSKTQ